MHCKLQELPKNYNSGNTIPQCILQMTKKIQRKERGLYLVKIIKSHVKFILMAVAAGFFQVQIPVDLYFNYMKYDIHRRKLN